MISLSVVMPCHNRASDLPRILQAYECQSGGECFEIIAVDDASTDLTRETLAAQRPERYVLRVERLAVNSGPAAARNHAIALAQAPLLLFVGDDILPEPGLVEAHLRLHRQHPAQQVAVLGRIAWPDDLPCNTLMAHIDGVGAQQFSYHYMRDGEEYDFRHLYTSNVSLKRALLQAEPYGFDPEFTFAAFEDAELAYRLAKHGLRIVYSTQPLARHYHYHSIWSFAQRQYRAGRMLTVFNRKHPNVRELGRLHIWLARLRQPVVVAARFVSGLQPALRAADMWLEETALELASYYEWQANVLLDDYYRELLRYFWRKGVIDGTIERPGQAAWAHAAHAAGWLAPLVSGYMRKARRMNLPLPEGFDHVLLARLDHVHLPWGLVRQYQPGPRARPRS